MKAYHFPIDHPYAAVTDKDGKFRIEGCRRETQLQRLARARSRRQPLPAQAVVTIEVDKETKRLELRAPTKIRRRPKNPRRAIAYQRLLNGGELAVTQLDRPVMNMNRAEFSIDKSKVGGNERRSRPQASSPGR
jgi:hypothetical protein